MRALVLGRPRVRLQTRDTPETDHRLSASPVAVEEKRGPPSYWAVLFLRAVALHPAGYDPLLAHRNGEVVVAFR